MASPKLIWAEFAGLGYVAGPFASTVISGVTNISGDVYTVTMLWTDIYGDNQLMLDNVGAQVYVEGYSNRNVPDGYYTITAAATTTVTITGKFSSAPSAGAPTSTATVRIEDFYKICTDIPDFVTGEAARARWVPSILEDGLTATLGQKIDVRGSVASFDGFSLSYALPNQSTIAQSLDANTSAIYTELQKILRTDPTFVRTLVGTEEAITVLRFGVDFDDDDLDKRGTATINNEFVSTNVAYNNRPALLGREAIMIVEDDGAGVDYRTYNIIRGVLGTDAETHQKFGAIYEGLQTGQAATVRLRKINKDVLTYSIEADYTEISEGGLIYIGIVENVKISNGSSQVSVELSPQLFASAKNSAGDKLSTVGKVERYTGTQTRFAVRMNSRYDVLPWEWVKLGPIAVRLRRPTDPAVNTTKTINSAAAPFAGVYETLTALDDIAYDPDYPGYNDNHVILDPTDDLAEFNFRSRTYPRAVGTPISLDDVLGVGDEAEGQRDRVSLTKQNFGSGADILLNREGLASFSVVHIDVEQLITEKAEPCHIFKASIFAADINDDNLYTDSYRSYITLADVLLQILTSKNGDGANGSFDVLPPGLGLGISFDAIEWDSFGWDPDAAAVTFSEVSSDKRTLILQNVALMAKDTEKLNEWISKKILQPVNLSLVQTDAGKVRLVDMTAFGADDDLAVIDENDLEYDFGTKNLSVSQTYDAKQLFDRIIGVSTNPTVSPAFGQTSEVITVPNLGSGTSDEDFDELTATAQLFNFIQAEPLRYEHPFLQGSQVGIEESSISGAASYAMSIFSSRFADTYGNIIPGISFTARQDLLEIGSRFRFEINNIIGSDGSLGVAGAAILFDKQTNILAEQSRYECIVISDALNIFNVWSASANVLAGSSATIINVSSDVYTDPTASQYVDWTEDVRGFSEGDSVLLYDQYFTLLSKDAGGAAVPRVIDSITQGSPDTITLVSGFTDNTGAIITPSAGDIIMHGDFSLQGATTQSQQSWFGRTQNQ